MKFLIKFILRTKLIDLDKCEYIGDFNYNRNCHNKSLYKYKNKYIILVKPKIQDDVAVYIPRLKLKKKFIENQDIELYKKVFGR